MRLLPEASSYVIFELAGELAGSAYMVGTLLRPVLVELRGEVDRVGIRFQPGMASLLFDVSASDFRDRVAGLSDASIRAPSSLVGVSETFKPPASRLSDTAEPSRGVARGTRRRREKAP